MMLKPLFQKGIENKIYQFVTHPDLDLYVTWPGLENCLKGLREALDSVKQSKEELVAAIQSSTTPRPIEQKFTQTVCSYIIYIWIWKKTLIHFSFITQTPVPPAKTPPPLTLPARTQSPVVSLQPETKYVHETVYVNRPVSGHGTTQQQPSKELQDILSKLGTLNERHEKLRELVERLKVRKRKKETL